ncbi:PREDICTED: agamous-like MADS-box protein AGL61 isoform X1 [Nicotiana attenuata]|uniref:Agamous-like mads-box protein agl62 n=2 Tax=Nicotiana attenuata TaxID=49451 RepID=A0A1J6J5V2_NICAT|nr:PREDICTED: agamous-like MADS-box protein AGL61 isoform X1 [Nicotiana attenuata]OIT08048.1 agamous-like mads-box protein agl62 [Nicotiana attenuata]
MVRTKLEIKRIEDKAKRHTTFTKRRQGLFKKAKELAKRCDAQAAVITFSLAGNVFAFGHPSVDDVVNRYIAATSAPEGNEIPVHKEAEKKDKDVVIENNVDQEDEETTSFELPVGDMGMDELEQFEVAMVEMKKKVVDRINGIISNSKYEDLGSPYTGLTLN